MTTSTYVHDDDCCYYVYRGSTAEAATQDIIENHIPRLRELCQNGDLHIDNIDVFCEKGNCCVSTPDVLHGVYSCQILQKLCVLP